MLEPWYARIVRRVRHILRVVLGCVVFVTLCYPASTLRLYAVREGYRLAESVGLMDPAGLLGGQVMGFNFQREPVWAHWLVWIVATVLVFGPLVVVGLALATPGGVRARVTLCGRCGRTLHDLAEPCCPHCSGSFA